MFIGYGGGGFALKDPIFQKQAKVFKKAIEVARKKIPNLKIVFVAHGPPYGTKLDKVIDSHVGCKDYVDFVKKNKIDIMFCGHIHECEGKQDKIGNTLIVNPGHYGMVFET
ncbi:hypothetical protein DRJ17_01610 [Candidatus Woesearchaeota archaeon]|nr:MAG: hypothetical protein DRJ17_01610 [Candidatus Woesearchaeota archaeon]